MNLKVYHWTSDWYGNGKGKESCREVTKEINEYDEHEGDCAQRHECNECNECNKQFTWESTTLQSQPFPIFSLLFPTVIFHCFTLANP